ARVTPGPVRSGDPGRTGQAGQPLGRSNSLVWPFHRAVAGARRRRARARSLGAGDGRRVTSASPRDSGWTDVSRPRQIVRAGPRAGGSARDERGNEFAPGSKAPEHVGGVVRAREYLAASVDTSP